MKTLKNRALRRILLLAVCFGAGFGYLPAQKGAKSDLPDRDKAISYAYRCLNGVGTTLDYKKAVGIFLRLAATGDAEACNAVGMMYKLGLGTVPNDEKAFSYFTKAAGLGYARANYNIGLMYKYGHGVEQDLTKAMEYIEKSPGNDYVTGYAHYKGMGKKQSYTEAVKYFKQGAEAGDAGSMYMLGLCYFKGRGVERNIELGKYWFEQAADGGVTRAIDLMARNDSKTYGSKKVKLRSAALEPINALVPKKYLKVANAVKDNSIAGNWEGKIISYDWSGEEIEGETKLQVSLSTAGGTVEGSWTESDSATVAITATMDESGWTFDNIVLHEGGRPIEMKSGSFRREYRDGEEYLTGNVSFYCEQTREYTSPSYVALKRISKIASSIEASQTASLAVYPNPFDDCINVAFALENAGSIRFVIYDAAGKRIYTSDLENYTGGEHNYVIPAGSIPPGSYTLKIIGKSVNKSVKLIK
ncbi:T9SS type A sorting domain-containing protein [Viscerimonas tarda]